MNPDAPGYTSKQMGDACEMLIAAELTLAGVPALKVPDNWPCYDVIAQPFDREAQRISVKSRTFKRGGDTFVTYDDRDRFDWLAIVLLPGHGEPRRRIFIAAKGQPGTATYFGRGPLNRIFVRGVHLAMTGQLRQIESVTVERLLPDGTQAERGVRACR